MVLGAGSVVTSAVVVGWWSGVVCVGSTGVEWVGASGVECPGSSPLVIAISEHPQNVSWSPQPTQHVPSGSQPQSFPPW